MPVQPLPVWHLPIRPLPIWPLPIRPLPVQPLPIRPLPVRPLPVPPVSVIFYEECSSVIQKAFFLCYVVAMYQVAKLQCLDYRHCRIHRNCKPNVSVAPECTAWARRGRGVGALACLQCSNCWAHWADGKRQKPLYAAGAPYGKARFAVF